MKVLYLRDAKGLNCANYEFEGEEFCQFRKVVAYCYQECERTAESRCAATIPASGASTFACRSGQTAWKPSVMPGAGLEDPHPTSSCPGAGSEGPPPTAS
jgi:hypothetical protein